MAEWLKAAVLKTVVAATLPGVRIPLSLQVIIFLFVSKKEIFIFIEIIKAVSFKTAFLFFST